MALEDLEGISNVQYTAQTIESVTWETAADWDNGTSDGLYHPSGTLIMGLNEDTWEDYTVDTEAPGPWTKPEGSNLAVDDSRSSEGSQSWGGFENGVLQDYLASSAFTTRQYEYPVSLRYYETSSNTNTQFRFETSSGDSLFSVGTNNPAASFEDADGYFELESSPDPDYGEWRQFTLSSWDWDNRTVGVEWEDLTGNSSSVTGTIDFKSATTDDIDRVVIFHDAGTNWGGQGQVEFWVDNMVGVTRDATMTTGIKSFGQAGEPDFTDLSYSLNNQSITLTAIGSPGTGSEETNSVSLAGGSEYTINWSNSHQDFAVEALLDTDDHTETPTLDSVSLEAEITL
jgi:hypothetical protein